VIVDTRCTMHEDCRENGDLAERCWQSYLADLNAIRVGDDVVTLGIGWELNEFGRSGFVFGGGTHALGRVVTCFGEAVKAHRVFCVEIGHGRSVTTTGVELSGYRLLKVDVSTARLERLP